MVKKELGIDTTKLIIIILLINLVAILGFIYFRDYLKKIGNITTLKITIVIWGGVSAYLLEAKSEFIDTILY
jgi:UMF1 family MFS transporter